MLDYDWPTPDNFDGEKYKKDYDTYLDEQIEDDKDYWYDEFQEERNF